MSSALLLEISLTAGITLAIAAASWFARKYPNRSKDYPERVRIPKMVLALGWIFIGVGLLMGLAVFTSSHGPLGARIASVAIVAGGLAFIAAYRNFYVAPRRNELAFRSVLGREHLLPYSDIEHYQVSRAKGQRFLALRFTGGVKLSINIDAYDMTPTLRAIDYHHVTGRWPSPVSVAGDGGTAQY